MYRRRGKKKKWNLYQERKKKSRLISKEGIRVATIPE